MRSPPRPIISHMPRVPASLPPSGCCVCSDDFDLPTNDFDSDTDERAMPKRNDEEKWTELGTDEFLNPHARRPRP
jgi:hypothetical protein